MNFKNELQLTNFIGLLDSNDVEIWENTYDVPMPFSYKLWGVYGGESERELLEVKLTNIFIKDILNNYFDFEGVDLVSFVKKHNLVERTLKGGYWKEEWISSFKNQVSLKEEIEYELVCKMMCSTSGNSSMVNLLNKYVYTNIQ